MWVGIRYKLVYKQTQNIMKHRFENKISLPDTNSRSWFMDRIIYYLKLKNIDKSLHFKCDYKKK